MIYITGDTHRDFKRLNNLVDNEDDMLIVLGDAGINYFLNDDDKKLKENLNSFNIKLFCIRGNHEERPENIDTYKETIMFSGKVFIEDEYPNLVFGKDEYSPKYNSDGYEIVRDYCTQKDIYKDGQVLCPKCNSNNVIVQKGDGRYIYGVDEIAIICIDCRKVYGFNDVNYKSGCPNEL